MVQSRYVVIERIAVGGMGEVFVARQQGVGNFRRTVVLKRLLQNDEGSDEALGRMLDEARIGAALNHENVVGIIEVGEDPHPFLALEYVHGENAGTLRTRAAKRGIDLPVIVVARIVADSARGLEHAHRAHDVDGRPLSIVHRDIAPKNIFVRHDGVSKVGDFGIAHAAERLSRTATGAVAGTLTYMAPEQLQNDTATAKSDQFSLGIVLWELLTSRRLFGGNNLGPVAVAERILSATITPPSRIRSEVPRALDAITLRMLERDPDKRFPDCGEVVAALERAVPDAGTAVGRAAVQSFVHTLVGPELEERQRRIEHGRVDGHDDTLRSLPPAWRVPSVSRSASGRATSAAPLGALDDDDARTAPSRPRREHVADTVLDPADAADDGVEGGQEVDDDPTGVVDESSAGPTRTAAPGSPPSPPSRVSSSRGAGRPPTGAAPSPSPSLAGTVAGASSSPSLRTRAAVAVVVLLGVVGALAWTALRPDRGDDDLTRTRAYLTRAIDRHPLAWQEAFLTSAAQAGADPAVAEGAATRAMALMTERLTLLRDHLAKDAAARQAEALAVAVEEQRLEAAAHDAFSPLPPALAKSALDLWALDSTAPRGWLPPRSRTEIQATLRKSGLHYMGSTAKSRREIVDRLWQRAGVDDTHKPAFRLLIDRYEAALVASSEADVDALDAHQERIAAVRAEGEAYLGPLCPHPWPAVIAGAAFLSQPSPEHWVPIYERTPSERDQE